MAITCPCRPGNTLSRLRSYWNNILVLNYTRDDSIDTSHRIFECWQINCGRNFENKSIKMRETNLGDSMSLFRFLESPTMSSVVRVGGDLQSCLPEPGEILSHSWPKCRFFWNTCASFFACDWNLTNSKADKQTETCSNPQGKRIALSCLFYLRKQSEVWMIRMGGAYQFRRVTRRDLFFCLLQSTFCNLHFAFLKMQNSTHWLFWPFISPVITVVMLRKWHLYKRLSICHVRKLQYSSSEL